MMVKAMMELLFRKCRIRRLHHHLLLFLLLSFNIIIAVHGSPFESESDREPEPAVGIKNANHLKDLLFLPSLSSPFSGDGRVIRAVAPSSSAASSSSSSSIICPRRCTCEDAGGDKQKQELSPLPLPTVTCSRQNLTKVPEAIPGHTKKLDLSWNNLTQIQPHDLSHLSRLQELSLKGNEMEEVEESAFSNLTRLKELILSKNKLSRMPPSEALPPSLEILDLEHNRITSVEGRVLARNGRIRALRLGNNQIDTIAEDAFQDLMSLTILELNENRLTEVPEALSRLPNLQELSLANNRIHRIELPFHETIPHIVLLQVKGNPIVSIHPDGFANLDHLKKLILSDVKNLTEFPHLNGTHSLEVLRIDRCSLQSVPHDLCAFTPNLKSLDLKSNLLRRLPNLSPCLELRVLDLGTNLIEEMEESSLETLSQLHDLHLPRNKVARIEADTFKGLSNLRNLDLSDNLIDYIDPRAFLHVRQLQDLNLAKNIFPHLPHAGLDRIVELKTQNNPHLREFPGPEYFPMVRKLVLSYAYHCCPFVGAGGSIPALVPPLLSPPEGGTGDENNMIQESIWYPTEGGFGNVLDSLNLSSLWPGIVNLSNKAELANDFWKTFETDIPTGSSPQEDGDGGNDIFTPRYRPVRPNEVSCQPLPGPFLPCNDLFDWWTLRCGVWIVFLLALMGNGTVVFVLIFARTKMDVPRFLVCNLAIADFFMGVYLGFLAVVDAATLGEFRRFAIPWQLSSACQIAGFMGVLSSELSVFTLAVITMERHYAITHAMHLNKRLSLRHASYIMVIGWIFALIMAILPLFGISDYRKFAVCLPFETTNPASMGYVVFLMFANGVAFTILMGCYLKMYCSIRGSQAWNSNDTRIAKRMALLVFTDLLCWFPIAFFSLTAVFGLQLVSLEEAKVFTVFILPLNSCCNPFLYAILTKQFKKDCVLICKAIEESRVTRGIGRCRHSSNFSNRQTAPNTGSLTEKSSKDGQPCICHSGLHPNGGDVNGNAKYRFIQSPERLRSMGPVGRFFSKYILCHEPSKESSRQREEDYRMRNVRRYLYNTAQTNYPPDVADGKHQRHASVSSDNFSSSRSDSWRVQNRCGIPLRMIEPRRRNSWAVTRKPSQDSNLSSSRNDSSATSNSTATWRLSRSSVSSDAASHSGGGKSSFKRISGLTGPSPPTTVVNTNQAMIAGMRPKLTMPTSTAAVAAAAAAAAVATGSAAAADLSMAGSILNPTVANSDDEMAVITMTNTIQNQNPSVIGITMSPQLLQKRASVAAAATTATMLPPAIKMKKAATTAGAATATPGKKKKKKRVKIKKPPKKEITIIRSSHHSTSGAHPEIDDDEIDDEEASAKIATNRPRLVRQSAFFSDEVVIEPEICPVHGPLNPGTYDDEDDDDEEVSELDEEDDDDDDDEDEEEGEEGGQRSNNNIEEEDEDIEDPTSPILRKPGGLQQQQQQQQHPQQQQIAGIALVIVPRRLSTVRGSRDDLLTEQSQSFIRPSGSSSSINNTSPGGAAGGLSPSTNIPTSTTGGGHSSTNSPTALLLPAGMAHFGRRKMSEQPVKFYVVPATTGLLTSAKWHSMSCVDGAGGGTSPPSPNAQRQQQQGGSPNYPQSPSPTSLRSQTQQQHSRSHSPRQFPRHEFINPPPGTNMGGRRLSSSIAETAEEIPTSDRDHHNATVHHHHHHQRLIPEDDDDEEPMIIMDPLQRPLLRDNNLALNEQRRVSFQLPGIHFPPPSPQQFQQSSTPNSPPERVGNDQSRRGSSS